MTIALRSAVADTIAKAFAANVNPASKQAVRFPDVMGDTSQISIPSRYGHVPTTLYHPPSAGRVPAVFVNVHGGGFVVGHPEQDDPWCRYLAAVAGVVVVNPDYVLAPHHRFPAAPLQIYDIACWTASPERQWDGSRLCIGGQSAGGNLSAAAARMARDAGGPRIALQVLHYAPLDLVTATRKKPSVLGSRAVMKPWMGAVFDTAYIPDRARRTDPLASPAWGANADALQGIAPAVVVTAEYDRLRNEGRAYADKLAAADALVEYYEVSGVDHGYNIMSEAAGVTERVYSRLAGHVARATGSS